MTFDDEASTADAQQAAYFRESLVAERRRLLDGIIERQPLVERLEDIGRPCSSDSRARAVARDLDRLIERLDRRFASRRQDPN